MPADNFGDLNTDEEGVKIDPELLAKKIAYDKIFFNCYNTPEGKRMFEAMRARLVDVTIYHKGATLEDTSYNQGMADVVLMMEACVDDAVNPPQDNN